MRVLVTRPAEDARAFAQMLRIRGHEAAIAPLLEIRLRDGGAIALEDVQAILATSANGVRAIARRTSRRDVPVFAVGPQTTQEAEAAGFTTVRNAEGDATALINATRHWASPDKGALLHAAGGEAPKTLAAELKKSGFTVRRENLYDAIPAETLPDAARTALQQNTIDAVMLFSPRSARLFATLTTEAGLASNCQMLVAMCISAATADALAPLKFRQIRMAPNPSQEGMLLLLG
jgi:uroporphyrinogen-III synthase